MNSIFESTDAFEAWMRKRTDVSQRLLKKKHRQIADDPFPSSFDLLPVGRAVIPRWTAVSTMSPHSGTAGRSSSRRTASLTAVHPNDRLCKWSARTRSK
jgi:hypothetical protein